MFTIEKAYGQFVGLVCEDRVYSDSSITFEEICMMLGVRRECLDALLVRELGFTGAEILETCRSGPNKFEFRTL